MSSQTTPAALPLWLAAFALMLQIALGAVIPYSRLAQTESALLETSLVICHADPTPSHGASHGPNKPTGCVLCPLCLAIAQAATALAPALLIFCVTTFGLWVGSALPPVRAPPGRYVGRPYPTGPPALV